MSCKSPYVREFSEVLICIFTDTLRAYPVLVSELEGDLDHLLAVVQSRGVSTLTVDLPAAGKHFDRCLAEKRYLSGGIAFTKGSAGSNEIPDFLRGLISRIFDDHGCLREEPDVEAIFFCRQIYFACKKVKLPCPEVRTRNEIQVFLEVDASLPVPDSFWDIEVVSQEQYSDIGMWRFATDPTILNTATTPDSSSRTIGDNVLLLTYLDIVSGFIVGALGPYQPDEWSFQHGPGSVSNLPESEFKYEFTNWPNRLESAYSQARYAYFAYSSWARHQHLPLSEYEPASKLMAVPKDFLKPRLIAAEPVEHMWCQQNLRHYMYQRTEASEWLSSFIKFDDQTLNQSLALKASTDGRLATVDLSAASDRLTCLVAQLFWRSNPPVLTALRACRTRFCSVNGVDTKLRKFATMGNACTFPVQSFLFLAITIASVLFARRKVVSLKNIKDLIGDVAVFGDDIIVPVDSREPFEMLMNLLWFKINTSKTYWTGRFRESCGIDAFAGESITPAYYRGIGEGKPRDIAMMIDVSNNFYKKYMLTTCHHIARTVPAGIPVVSMSSGVAGFKSRTPIPTYLTRWNRRLQRDETRILLLRSKQRNESIATEASLLQFFTEDPDPNVHWESGVKKRPSLKLGWDWVAVSDLG